MSQEDNLTPLEEVLASKKYFLGNGVYKYADVRDAAAAIIAGYDPLDLEFAYRAVPDTELWGWNGGPAPYPVTVDDQEEQIIGHMNDVYGIGKWQLVEVVEVVPPDEHRSPKVCRKVFLNRDLMTSRGLKTG